MERSQRRLPNGRCEDLDSMIKDGLWDPYGDKHMGNCAEMCADKYTFTREAQDAFALESYKRAQGAMEAGEFEAELAAVSVPQRKGDPIVVDKDEEPFGAPLDKMGKLRPAFDKNGTVTAANASKINDGAAAMVLMSADEAAAQGLKPLAKIVSYASHAHEPDWFTTAPVDAAKKALDKAGLKASDIDLWEINEAFAVVTMASVKDLELDESKVNVRGGAVALGHPIGCFRCTYPHHPPSRPQSQGRQVRLRQHLHRRWRSCGDGCRGTLSHLRFERQPGLRLHLPN